MKILLIVAVLAGGGDGPTRIYSEGQRPPDARLAPPRTLNDVTTFTPPKTLTEWEQRKTKLRDQIRKATGTIHRFAHEPTNPVIHGRIERDDYTIEKVYFFSRPGHVVSGNLYRPKVMSAAKRPGVLLPHGHWADGRFHDAGAARAKREVASGAESNEVTARYFTQSLGVHLARMGCVAFAYDMVGYADSTAVTHREGFNDIECQLHGVSTMHLQTVNSVRALDFLCQLPDVDATKIGVTGASGGGTQTFILAAIDDRPAAIFPAVMVSQNMQGGCVCENCSGLRVGTNNVEIAALFAPKPMALSAANDWTRDLETSGFPQLQSVYRLYGAEANVATKCWPEFGHNFNQPAREFMYTWFNKHLLGRDEPFRERPFEPVPPRELSVFNAQHPRPAGEMNAAALRADMIAANRVSGIFDDDVPSAIAVRKGPIGKKVGGATMHLAVLGRPGGTDAVPHAGVFGPKFRDRVVIWVHPNGKASLFDGHELARPVRRLVDAGFAVVAPDTLGTGELAFDKPRTVDAKYPGFTFCYNRPIAFERASDILVTVGFARSMLRAKQVHLIGWGEAGPVALVARSAAGDAVNRSVIDLNHFRFEDVRSADHPMLIPGAMAAGGLSTFVNAAAPNPVRLHNGREPIAIPFGATQSDRPDTPDEVIDFILER